ncbi:TetR/AcrR family transcriptional regulator [Nocardiopsis coralliicola]
MAPSAAHSAERGAHVRARLLAAAAALIGERGWGAVSTRSVAERAGVAPGLVHYHFASLQALLRTAALQTIGQVLDESLAALPGSGAGDGVALLAGSLDAYSGDDPTCHVFTETYLAATRDPELRAAVTGALEQMRAGVAEWLAAAGTADPERTAAVIVACLDGMMLHRAFDPGLTSAAVVPVLRRAVEPAADPGTRQTEGVHP